MARTPLHEQLYRELHQKIRSRQWPPGHRLPSELDIAQDFRVSRGTARQAIARLVTEGLVERTAGRGSFVASRRLVYPVVDLLSFTEQILAAGHHPSSQLVDISETTDAGFGDRALSIERVRLADSEPVALEHLLLPLPRFAGLREVNLETTSVYETLEAQFGVRIELGDFTLDIETLTSRQAELLNEDAGAPVFLMSGNVFDQDGQVVLGVRCYYRRSRYSFHIAMPRGSATEHRPTPPRMVLTAGQE